MKFAPARSALLAALVLLLAAPLHARSPRLKIDAGPFDLDRAGGHSPQASALAAGPSGMPPMTLAYYDFETMDPMGWTSVDKNNLANFLFYIASGNLLDGGSFGRLVPLAGGKSLWCGIPVAPLDQNFCSYAAAPGYGNRWNEAFESIAITKPAGSDIVFQYVVAYDTEAGYDEIFVEYQNPGGDWVSLTLPSTGTTSYTGLGWPAINETIVIPGASLPSTSVRLRFRFQSDNGYSDQDGLLNTDGPVLIDNVRVMTGTLALLNEQTFEPEGDFYGNTNDLTWWARSLSRGDFAQLYAGSTTLQRSPPLAPGDINTSSLWGFYNGSPDTYSCGGFASYASVPKANTDGSVINNAIRSPWIAWEPVTGQTTHLRFQVYRDLPRDNLVCYQWWVRTRSDGGCPTRWTNNSWVYFGSSLDWHTAEIDVSSYIATTSGADEIQFEISVIDMAPEWAGVLGSGACHSNAPLVDNVEIFLDNTHSWVVEDIDLFQDTFADDGTLTGTIRADAASGEDVVRFRVAEPGIGIATEGNGPAVFCHVKSLPNKSGGAVSGGAQFPFVPSQSDNDWTVIQCANGDETNEYIVDLNDDLYQPGDVVYFYFSARSLNAVTSYYSQFTGRTNDQNEVRAQPMEFTGLPTGASSVLYVDYFSGYGAEPYLDTAFDGIGVAPDRYDVRAPSSLAGNGPGDHMVSEEQIFAYDTILLNTGWFEDVQLSETDWLMLAFFCENHTKSPVGLYLSGDNFATAWAASSEFGATYLRNTYCDFTVLSDSHRAQGLPVSPLVIPAGGSPFSQSLVAFGGSASPAGRFDVLLPGQNAVAGMTYGGDPGKAAVVMQSTVSPVSQGVANVVLAGFSHHKIRDDEPSDTQDRTLFLNEVLEAVAGNGGTPVTVDGPALGVRNSLEQNTPNPFNPVTRIRYSIRQRGNVSLVVYNVAGERVATLVNAVQEPRASGFTVNWDGHSDTGVRVASGVYFYKLTAPGFVQTRKMILLK